MTSLRCLAPWIPRFFQNLRLAEIPSSAQDFAFLTSLEIQAAECLQTKARHMTRPQGIHVNGQVRVGSMSNLASA